MKIALVALIALSLGCGAAEARTWRVRPGPTAQQDLQGALSSVRPGDVIQLARGRYDLTAGLTLSVDRVAIRGEGQDKSVLSFASAARGGGVVVTSSGAELRDFAVEDAQGDGVTVRDCHGVTLRDVRAEWTHGPDPRNGAFGLRAVNCDNVLIQETIARGATDAGIQVSQSRNIIIRDSVASSNVAGIEVENSFNADLFNNTALHNAAGIVLVDVPGLAQHGGHSIRVFTNKIGASNTPNFAPPNSMASAIPSGTGLLIVATRDVHVFQNQLGENGTANIIIGAYRGSVADPAFNALPHDIMIRNNQFGRSGFAPSGDLAALAQGGVHLPDVLWDGATTYIAGGTPHQDIVHIVMKDNKADAGGAGAFLSLGVEVAGSDLSEATPDPTPPPLLDLPEPARVEIRN